MPHCPHYISVVHQHLFLILEDGDPVRLHFVLPCSWYTHSTCPRSCWSRGCLDGSSEFSTKVSDLINRESCQHSPEIRQPPPVPIVVVRYHPWQQGAQRADVLVPVANVDYVQIRHQRVRHGQKVPSVVRHDTGLRLGEYVGDEALEVSILLRCRVVSNAGFLGDTRISHNLKVLLV